MKIYGVIAGEKRVILRRDSKGRFCKKGKGKYYSITRDKKGKFAKMRKWSRDKPNKKREYKEYYEKAKAGKQLLGKVKEIYEEEVWEEFTVESP